MAADLVGYPAVRTEDGRRANLDAAASAALVAAAAISIAVTLWFGRDLTFYNLDELIMLRDGRWSLDYMLEPFLAQLIAATRLVYQTVLSTFGTDYLVLQMIGSMLVVIPAALFFVIARRRIGAPAALALTLPLLFLGSAWEYLIWPYQAISIGLALSFGLGALIVLERDSRMADVGACGLLCLAITPFGLGLAFVAGAAVQVLRRADRLRRAWIFVIPIVLYGIWYVARVPGQESQFEADNLYLIPVFVADSLATTLAALLGLNFSFGTSAGFTEPPVLDDTWGPVLALVALAAFAWRLARGRLHPWVWVAMAVLGFYWVTGAVVVGEPPNFRFPGASRYLYPSALMVLLVAAWCLDGWRPSRRVLIALFAIAAISIPGNLAQLRKGRQYLEAYTQNARAQLAAIELAGDRAPEDFVPGTDTPQVSQIQLLIGAGDYLRAADRFGSIAYSIDELLAQSEEVRHGADVVLATALGLRAIEERGRVRADACREMSRRGSGRYFVIELPRGGALLNPRDPAGMRLRRFADVVSEEFGELPAGRFSRLEIPPDGAPRPWVAVLETPGPVTLCPLDAA